jgi:hypothetical protein
MDSGCYACRLVLKVHLGLICDKILQYHKLMLSALN